jgi:hypothetical protein
LAAGSTGGEDQGFETANDGQSCWNGIEERKRNTSEKIPGKVGENAELWVTDVQPKMCFHFEK